MTDQEFHTLLSCAIVPQVVDLIARNEKLSETDALNTFYRSETYAFLEREDSKVWHYSPMALYHIWKSERETGKPEWPEEGLLV
ncbi:MAG TPA: hypothetical protein IAB32_00380 [Candidatus Scatosoma pullicola]|nr:hypothetical protein [Candidatus Scatosoma pullicola]